MKATENLPRQFHSQGDKQAEIERLENLRELFIGAGDKKSAALTEKRLRIVRGIVARS